IPPPFSLLVSVVLFMRVLPPRPLSFFFSKAPPPTAIYTLSLHDALPISLQAAARRDIDVATLLERYQQRRDLVTRFVEAYRHYRSEEHTSELQSRRDLVCRLLLEKKKKRRRKGNKRTGGRRGRTKRTESN